MPNSRRDCWFGLVCCLLISNLASANPSASETDLPRNDQHPALKILIVRCLECHGTDLSGGLDLRTHTSALAGGESGAGISPENPLESMILEYVTSDSMPPKHPLTEEEKQILTDWVEKGAAYPETPLDMYEFTTEERAGYDWWSLQPLQKVAPPETPAANRDAQLNSESSQNPVDRFIQQQLAHKNLKMNPRASREIYMRRLSYDLTGLLPTHEEIQAFVNDDQPDAEERLVDRLLESPHYGERWGRHWLDLVRFAESNGFERDRLRTNLWPYRDYVIRSFNRDLPYNEFVLQQLAGDALAPNDPESLIATGFLSAGPKNDVETVSEREQKITLADELDEYVSTVSTTFLGLTVGCARCHDHKYDPIPTADYYAMTAIFSGLDRGDVTVASPEVTTEYQTRLQLANQELHFAQQSLDEFFQQVQLAQESQIEALTGQTQQDLPGISPLLNSDPIPPTRVRHVRMVIHQTFDGSQPCIDEFALFGLDEKFNLGLASQQAIATASSVLPGFDIHKISHLNDGLYGNSHSWISEEPGTGWISIEFPTEQLVSRIEWGRDREGRYQDRLASVYDIEGSLDGINWTLLSSSRRRPAIENSAPKDEAALVATLTSEQKLEYERLSLRRTQSRKILDGVGTLPNAYLAISRETRPIQILYRGDVSAPREVVAPGVLSAVSELETTLNPHHSMTGPERRLKLGKWIIDPQNPLTARVWVNRVWQYHFGIGLVDTPNDFGFNGDQPSHPELLDWLAQDFIEHGWSTKRLTRQIVLSEAYRQSSDWTAAAQIDGRNRLLWRYSPQRLTAEAVRDRILDVTGSLNRELYGPSFRLFEYIDGNVPDYVLLPEPGQETWRRGIYSFNIRTFSSPLMSAFDCPDPSVQTPVRPTSTTALQALSLMNSQFVFEQTKILSEKIERQTSLPKEQAQLAYQKILGRSPDEDELETTAQFISEQGLFSLCRVLLNTNEFMYVY